MSFKKYITEIESLKTVVFCFGRNNPPQKGHQALWEFVNKEALKTKGDGMIFTSWTQNPKKNPLSPKDKIEIIKKVTKPLKKIKVSEDSGLRTPFQILEKLVKELHYKRIIFVVGADRKNDFNAMKKYVTDWSKGEASIAIKGFEAERIGNYSGTNMRKYASENNYEDFKEGSPTTLKEDDIKDMFDKTRKGIQG